MCRPTRSKQPKTFTKGHRFIGSDKESVNVTGAKNFIVAKDWGVKGHMFCVWWGVDKGLQFLMRTDQQQENFWNVYYLHVLKIWHKLMKIEAKIVDRTESSAAASESMSLTLGQNEPQWKFPHHKWNWKHPCLDNNLESLLYRASFLLFSHSHHLNWGAVEPQ